MIEARSLQARAPSLARVLLCIALLACGATAVRAQEPRYPQPTGYVVDEAGLLTEETRAHLTEIARELDEKTKVQIAVAIVPSISPLSVEEYAVELFEQWGVGGKERDEGVLFVLARDERRVRIEVGYGLEGLLPDGRVGGILRRSVVPHLRQDDWNAGVAGAVVALASLIAEDKGVTLSSLAGVSRPPPSDDDDDPDIPGGMVTLLAMVIGFMIISSMMASVTARRRRRHGWGGWWMGPGGGFGGGGFGGWSGGGSGGGGGGFGGFGGGSSGGGGASSGF